MTNSKKTKILWTEDINAKKRELGFSPDSGNIKKNKNERGE